MDGGQRFVVIRVGIDADPVLREVHANHFVGGFGLADVRAEVADARDRPELLATERRDRTISGWDVPGVITQCIRKSRSLKSGSSDWPSVG